MEWNLAIINDDLFLPLSSNLVEDYPYHDSNTTYKLPLNFNPSPELLNARSNYIQAENMVFNPRIKELAIQREIINIDYDRINKLMQESQIPSYKTFQIGVDVRDCSYFYGTVSNTGYFVKENQNPLIVGGNNGFNFTSAVFNTFATDVANLINPLIGEAARNSSNMYNTVLNQRSDTYTALGKLNTITFSNAPSLNSSNILNMLRNNLRFINNIYLTFPRDTYLTSIKGFGITNSNTLQLLIDNTTIIRNDPVPIFGEIRTEILNYRIQVTNNYLDYTPHYLNTEPLGNITKDYVLNMSNTMNYASGSNNIISNRIPLSNYVKLIQGSNNYSWIPESPPIEWFNSNILSKTLSVVGYLPEDIESFNFLQNSIEFNIKTTENLPFSKKNFK
jgi:hypothetical protein